MRRIDPITPGFGAVGFKSVQLRPIMLKGRGLFAIHPSLLTTDSHVADGKVVSLRDEYLRLRRRTPGGMDAQHNPFQQPVLTVSMKRLYSSVRVRQRFAPSHPTVRSAGLVALLCSFVMLSACSPTKQLALDSPNPEAQTERATTADHSMPDVEYRLRTEIAEWAGTPHQLGGTTVHGIDCSAFVQRVYEDAFNLQLPRTTREQVSSGTSVHRRDLRPGDLVFFRPPTKSRHVGIYLNEGEFAHASSSQGVTISDLDQEYWDQAYWTSRRILPESNQPAIAEGTRIIGKGPLPYQPIASFDEEPRTRERIGW